MAQLGNSGNLTVDGFFTSLLWGGFDSWNITFRTDYFSKYLGGFDLIANATQKEFFSIVNEKLLNDFSWAWENNTELAANAGNFTSQLVTIINSFGTTTPTPIHELCETYYEVIRGEVAIFMLIPAAVVMFLLAFVQRRKLLCLSCLWGRPSFIFPINFVDEVGRRWAFAACFAMMTQYILDFFDQKLFWNPGYWNDPEWNLRYGWVSTLNVLGNVIHLGLLFYPLFACLTLRRLIPANILGLAYLAFWIYFDIDWYRTCGVGRDATTGKIKYRAIVRLSVSVPIFMAELAMAICFIYDLVLNIINYFMRRKGKELKRKSRWGGKDTLPLQYIEFLMTHQPQIPETMAEKLKNLCTYTKINGFKYPPRVVCTMLVAFLGLYAIATKAGIEVDELLLPIEKSARNGELVALISLFYNDSTIYRAPEYVYAIRWSIIISNVIAVILHVFFMIHMIISYRTHVLKVMKGDRTWHYTMNVSPSSMMVAGMRYSGYQIAYILWGFVIMLLILSIVTIVISTLVILPLIYGERSFLIDTIIKLAPTVAVSLLLYFGQLFLCKFVFLQDRGAYLALNNRRIYHCVCYFLFFFNVVVGVFSVLKRSLLSMIFGTMIISRLDRCLMMRGFERFDAGFKSYLAMIEVDVHHNHPIIKGFVRILKDEVADSKARRAAEEAEKNGPDPEKVIPNGSVRKRKIRKTIRNKWWKLITLVNNPDLVLDRLQKRVDEVKQNKSEGAKILLDTIADAGAVMVAGGILGGVIETTPL